MKRRWFNVLIVFMILLSYLSPVSAITAKAVTQGDYEISLTEHVTDLGHVELEWQVIYSGDGEYEFSDFGVVRSEESSEGPDEFFVGNIYYFEDSKTYFYTDETVQPGKTYTYKIFGDAYEVYSNAITITIPSETSNESVVNEEVLPDTEAQDTSSGMVAFTDSLLEAAVNEALGNPLSGVTIDDMLVLTDLELSGLGISDLTGLEHALNLNTLYLDNNNVQNIDVLESLPSLTFVELQNNPLDYAGGAMTTIQALMNRGVNVHFGQMNIAIADMTETTATISWLPIYGLEVDRYHVYVNGTLNQVLEDPAAENITLSNLDSATFYEVRVAGGLGDVDVFEYAPVYIEYGNDGTSTEEPVVEEAVVFNDSALVDAVRRELGVYDRDIYPSDMENLLYLYPYQEQISDLTGLEYAVNLEHLYLSDNLVEDISVLANLSNVQYLDISYNPITDFSPIQHLTGLKQLSALNLNLSDLTFLGDLSSLESLYLDFNDISDLTVLTNFPNLTLVALQGNPLDLSFGSETAAVIQSLKDNGVTVWYDAKQYDGYLWEKTTTESELHVSWGDYANPTLFEGYTVILNGTVVAEYGVDTLEHMFTNLEADTSYEVLILAHPLDGSRNLEFYGEFNTDKMPSGKQVIIQDTNLEQIIRNQLGILERDLYESDMEQLEYIDGFDSYIHSLAGLESAVNLYSLNIGYNQISDLTPLASLTNLQYLNLSNNNLSSLEGLSGLTSLRSLQLHNNQITDISQLSGLTNLYELNIWNNQIENIEALSQLENLEYLDVSFNQIANFDSLASLSKLTSVDVSGNALSFAHGDSSAYGIFQTLKDQGTDVYYGQWYEHESFNVNYTTEEDIQIQWPYLINEDIYQAYNLYLNDHLVGTFDSNTSQYTFTALTPATDYTIVLEGVNGFESTRLTRVVTTAEGPSGDVVPFTDENLKKAVQEELGITHREIFESDMEKLTYLYASYKQIASLSGLEYASNLVSLSLYSNNVNDVTPLLNLTNLESLDLSANDLEVIPDLSSLTSLTSLSLGNNNLTDISALESLTTLTDLNLWYNNITDLSPLANLVNLEHVYLADNQIADLLPLTLLEKLWYVNVEYNELNFLDTEGTNYSSLQLLLNRGVDVDYGQWQVYDSFEVGARTENQITINWSYLVNEGIYQTYNVYLDDILIDTFDSSVTEYTFTELSPETAYKIGLEGVNELSPVMLTLTVETAVAPSGDVVNFVDENLERAVQEELGIYHRELYDSDLERLTYLGAFNSQIHSLGGLEKAVNLQGLSLSYNAINSLLPIASLENLEFLNVSNNNLTTLKGISGLTELSSLYLSDNQLTDISELSQLTNLNELILSNNQLSNVESLSNLVNLGYLNLSFNNITDIRPLSTLTPFYGIEIEENPLDYISEDGNAFPVIKSWLDQGVDVSYGQWKYYNSLYVNYSSEETIQIQWEHLINENLYSSYQLYLDGTLVETFDNSVTEYTFEGLTPETAYTISIEAENGLGTGRITEVVSTKPAPTGEIVSFADNNLKLAIQQQLGISHRDVYESDMASLSYLFAENANITSLEGIEAATNIVDLDLWDNEISDLSPLTALENLAYLDVSFNKLTSVEPLASLTSLRYINIGSNSNPLSFAPLRSLEGLEGLHLWDNEMEDLSFVENMQELTFLNVRGNRISDITVLTALPFLNYVDIGNNPLDLTPESDDVNVILSLLDQEVNVDYGQWSEWDELWLDGLTETSLTIDWGHIANEQIYQSYDVYVNDSFVATYESGVTNHTFTNLEPGTEYKVALVGIGALGESTVINYLRTLDEPSGAEVIVDDINLKLGIMEQLGIEGRPLYESDMERLEYLEMTNAGITSLTGLETAINLFGLVLPENEIDDLTPVTALTNLEHLNVENNKISSIEGLRENTSLKALYVGGNTITDFEPLQTLVQLEGLGLSNIGLTNISVLSELTNLMYIDLSQNELTDVLALTSFDHLTHVILNDNPLDLTEGSSTLEMIRLLQENGVEVTFGGFAEVLVNLEVITDQSIAVSWMVNAEAEVDYTYEVWLNGEKQADTEMTHYVFEQLTPNTEYVIKIVAHGSSESKHFATLRVNTSSAPVQVADAQLEQAIRDMLGKPEGALTQQDLENLTYLSASDRGIKDLAGLEFAVNLISLDLSFNDITDISAFTNLTQLQDLILWDNQIANIDSLSGLTNLTYVDLDTNQIENYSPLSSLTSLQTLWLSSNPGTDITPLASLTNLTHLYLHNLTLDLSEASAAVKVLADLQANGTFVAYDGVIDLWATVNTVTEESATIEWFVEGTGNVTAYKVFVDGEEIAVLTEGQTAYQIQELAADTRYEVTIVAETESGYTTSASLELTTKLPAEQLKKVKLQLVDEKQQQVERSLEFFIQGLDENSDFYLSGYSTESGMLRTWNSTNESLLLPEGAYEIYVYGSGVYEDTVGDFIVEDESDEPLQIVVDKVVKETLPVTFEVVEANSGNAVTSLDYIALNSWNVTSTFGSEAGSHYYWDLSNTDGLFVTGSIVSGDDYQLSIVAEGYKPYYGYDLTLDAENQTIVIELEQGARVTGSVTDVNGNPLVANYYIYGQQSYGYGSTDGESFEIGGLQEENLTLEIAMEGYQTVVTDISVEQFVDGVVALEPIKMQSQQYVHGRVVTEDNEPVANVYVYLENNMQWYWARTDGDGYFKIRNVADETYTLTTEGYQLPSAEVTDISPSTDEYIVRLVEEGEGSFSGEGNSFGSSQKTVVPGKELEYRLDYKNNGEAEADAVEVKLNLPTELSLIEKSVLVNGLEAEVDKDTIYLSDVPAGEAGTVTFKATVSEDASSTLIAGAKMYIGEMEQTALTATTNVLFATINAPEMTASSEVKVYGNAKPGATVEILAGEVLLAKTTAEDRWWYADVKLPIQSGEGSTHMLTARVKDGERTAYSAPVSITYQPEIPKVTDVTIQAGWNDNVKLNPYTGIATFAIVEFTPIDLDVSFDQEIDEAYISFLGEEYPLELGEDNQYTGEIPGTWSSYGEQMMEIHFVKGETDITLPLMEVIVLIDPSGYVFEGSMDNRLQGAQAVVEQLIESDGHWKQWNAELYGQINPQITDVEGRYGWDVIQGKWRVIFSKDGYETYVSRIVNVPPAETQLNVPLVRTTTPFIKEISPEDGMVDAVLNSSVEIVFDRLMNEKNAEDMIQIVKEGSDIPVDGTFTLQGYDGYKETGVGTGYFEPDPSKQLSETFTWTPTEDLEAGTTYYIVIDGLMEDYDGKVLGEDLTYTFNTVAGEDEGNQNGEDPGDGTGDTGTEEPAEGEDPVTPEEPAEGEDPVTPEEPVEGEDPATPEEPVEEEDPVTPEEPVEEEDPVTPEEPVEGEDPVTPEESVEEENPSTPEDSGEEKGSSNEQVDEASDSVTSEKEELPKTSTNNMQWFLIGMGLLLVASLLFFIRRKSFK